MFSKVRATQRNKKKLIILNYTFVNGLKWLSRQVNKYIFVVVIHQNKEILHGVVEFCDVGI